MHIKSFFVSTIITITLFVTNVYSQNPVVKIDFDQQGRQSAEVSDPDYTAWLLPSTKPNTK